MSRIWDLPVGRAPSFWRRLNPAQLFVGSFALLILLGTLGLRFLPGLYTGEPLDFLDCLFTATSAVCVTGLVVADTGTHFTLRGQAFLLMLIQVGGLGMLTFTTLFLLAFGGRLSLRQEALSIGSPMDLGEHRIDPRRLTRDVVLFTLTFEALGAVFLYLLWVPRLGWDGAAWPAVFHSISAFCNAGFSTNSNSLVPYHDAPLTLLVISALVTIGGLGFLTLEELYLRHKARRAQRNFRLSLHTRLVLVMTIVLILTPWPIYLWLEWDEALSDLPFGHKLTNALFLSTGARTAGFNTLDHSRTTDATNFMIILLMSIGGSPGGMAGGMKTTTVALLGILAWTRFRGHDIASVWGRSLRKETTDRAVGLFVAGFVLVTIGILMLTVTERHTDGGFILRMFEAVSAFNIVGLSMGLTSQLTPLGRLIVVALMFLGRIGPLVLASALTRIAPAAGKFRYAYEEVAVG